MREGVERDNATKWNKLINISQVKRLEIPACEFWLHTDHFLITAQTTLSVLT